MPTNRRAFPRSNPAPLGQQQDWLTEAEHDLIGKTSAVKSFNFPARALTAHPLRLVKLLVQLGHEPVPPERRFNFLFQRYFYYYPGIIDYAGHIVHSEGWNGLYRGVGGAMVSDGVGAITAMALQPIITTAVDSLPSYSGNTDPREVGSLSYLLTRTSRMFLVSVLSKCAVQIVIHPFEVVTIRSVAQFIGKETVYNEVWSSLREIYQAEGLSGLYSGLAPALLGHVCSCIIYSSLALLFDIITSNISNNMGKVVVRTFIAFPLLAYIPQSISYPLNLMSSLMAVNDTGLAAGAPPRYPAFKGMAGCFRYLKSSGNMYRGFNILFPRFAYEGDP